MSYKRTIYLLMFLMLPMLGLGNTPSLLETGNRQYAHGQYKQAQNSYQKLINTGAASAALYFNMGNACYKNYDIPSALLYYEKAHRLSPGDEDINFNIRLANLKTTDKIDEAPEFFLTKWWHGFLLMFSLNALSAISIVSILLASVILIWYLFTRSETFKRVSFYTSIICFIIGLIFIFIANRQSAYFEDHKQAIIFSGTVPVKSSPATGAKTLFLLHEGTKVNMLETSNAHLRIRLANGSEGWIGKGDVKEI